MRTTDEIIERLEEREDHPVFDFGVMVLVACLPYEEAKPYIKEDVTREDFRNATPKNLEGWAQRRMRAYLPLAFLKAESERGLSAIRSVQKFEEWLWLAEEEEVLNEFQEAPYEPYGLPKLRVVRNHFPTE